MQLEEVLNLLAEDKLKVEAKFKSFLQSDADLIQTIGEYILKSGGKRFRPLMLLLSAKLCGYEGDRKYALAAVVEFIHTATLLHDDVVDNATLRRGLAAANTVWTEGASVLVGDFLLAKSFQIAVDDNDMRTLKVLADTTTQMAQGEVLQLIKHNDLNATEEDHLKVITDKTAILFSSACRLAAILAKESDEKIEALANYGMNIGIAYQLIDDCFDFISTDDEIGKPVGNDITEGKVTLPLIAALRDADEEETKIITEAVLSKETTQAQIDKAGLIVKKYDGIKYTNDKAARCIAEAKKALEVFAPSKERTALETVADFVISRKA